MVNKWENYFFYVICNVGGGYDVIIGIFIVLYSGVYVIMCFLVIFWNEVVVYFVLNGFFLVGILVVISGGLLERYGVVGNFVIF